MHLADAFIQRTYSAFRLYISLSVCVCGMAWPTLCERADCRHSPDINEDLHAAEVMK